MFISKVEVVNRISSVLGKGYPGKVKEIWSDRIFNNSTNLYKESSLHVFFVLDVSCKDSLMDFELSMSESLYMDSIIEGLNMNFSFVLEGTQIDEIFCIRLL